VPNYIKANNDLKDAIVGFFLLGQDELRYPYTQPYIRLFSNQKHRRNRNVNEDKFNLIAASYATYSQVAFF